MADLNARTRGREKSRVTPIEHVPPDGSCLWCEWVNRVTAEVPT